MVKKIGVMERFKWVDGDGENDSFSRFIIMEDELNNTRK